jgi:hypothetical protein
MAARCLPHLDSDPRFSKRYHVAQLHRQLVTPWLKDDSSPIPPLRPQLPSRCRKDAQVLPQVPRLQEQKELGVGTKSTSRKPACCTEVDCCQLAAILQLAALFGASKLNK